jgi:WW domain
MWHNGQANTASQNDWKESQQQQQQPMNPENATVDSSARRYHSTPTLDHRTEDDAPSNQEGNAFVLASLLHELTFWETTPKEFLRKSQSANDVCHTGHRPDAPLRASSLSASRSISQRNGHQFRQHDNDIISNSNGESIRPYNNAAAQASSLAVGTQSEFQNGSAAATAQPQTLGHETQRPDNSASNDHCNTTTTTTTATTPTSSPTLAELQAACPWQKAVDPATGRAYYYDVETRQSQWDKVYIYARVYMCARVCVRKSHGTVCMYFSRYCLDRLFHSFLS